MHSVPRKNIDPILSDIKISRAEPKQVVRPLIEKKQYLVKPKVERSNYRVSLAMVTIVVSLGLLSSFYVFKIFELKNNAHTTFDTFHSSFINALSYLKNKDFKNAAYEIGTVNKGIDEVGREARNFGVFQLSTVLGTFWDAAKILPKAFSGFQSLGQMVFELVGDLDSLEVNAMPMVFGGNGTKLIGILQGIESRIENIDKVTKSLHDELSQIENSKLNLGNLGDLFSKSYLENAPSFYEIQDLLASLIALLNHPNDLNILIMFQNSSEMRPAGGFLGSFAEVTLNKGSLTKIDVRDIYDFDGQLDLKFIPPKPLQLITTTWGARDANWFFDFPTSAEKVRFFLENSKINKEKNKKFEAVIAINDEVLKNILNLTGPIDVPGYGSKINSENFLSIIQEEVEAGKDKRAGHPKRILSVISPILLDKIRNFNDAQKKKILGIVEGHLNNKDIMVYFNDPVIENFTKNHLWAGDVFSSDVSKNGDYLAVVNSNIAGQKSDKFIEQEIDLISELSLSGDLKNNLIIKRTHSGDTKKEAWYKATNQDFIKVLVPSGAKFGFVEGNTKKSLPSGDVYKIGNYLRDEDIVRFEGQSSFIENSNLWESTENDRTSFSFWFNVPSGSSKTLKLDYLVPRAFDVKEGEYHFVFDKQSGVDGLLRIALVSPMGFKWKESGTEYFKYETRNPLSRITLTLHLIK